MPPARLRRPPLRRPFPPWRAPGRSSLRRLAAFAFLAGLAGCAATEPRPYDGACLLERRAEIPLVVERNFLLAPVTAGSVTLLMVVDTGSEATLVTPDAARLMRLVRDPTRFTVLHGAGGTVPSRNAVLGDMRLGGEPVGGRSVGVHGIGDFTVPGYVVGGLLGADVLARYEVDIDARQRRMTLYTSRGCGALSPWPRASVRVPLAPTPSGLLYVPVRVDGRPVQAMLDTGARSSLVTREVAHAAGVTDAVLDASPGTTGQGVDRRTLEFRAHRFARVDVGPIALRDLLLNVTDIRLPNIEMLLGADWFAVNHVWISYAAGAMFVATGPVP